MSTGLQYTVLPGDTYSSICDQIAACNGVTAAAIETSNPTVEPNNLIIGQTIRVPAATSGNHGLRYTIHPGDTLTSIAAGINACAGVTISQIEAANPQDSARDLRVGTLIAIPGTQAQPDPSPQVIPPQPPSPDPVTPENPALATIGYWGKTWEPSRTLGDATIGLAFSGYSDPTQALHSSAAVFSTLRGRKYLTLGGGNAAGRFSAAILQSIDHAISSGAFASYDGIAYDVEEGDAGLSGAFAQSFATAKAERLSVLVTVSHSAPFGITDAYNLMTSFLGDTNIDYLSPQLYTTGVEAANQWATSGGISWSDYAKAHAQIVPSLAFASYYDDARSTLAHHGVRTAGYVVWNC